MNNITRAIVFVVGGLWWFTAAFVLTVFAWSYFAYGAGLPFFTPSVSSGSVLLGLIHLLGFAAGAFLCFAIGTGLCAHGLVPPPQTEAQRGIRPVLFAREHWVRGTSGREPGLCCVRCEASLTSSVLICPGCGWTQP